MASSSFVFVQLLVNFIILTSSAAVSGAPKAALITKLPGFNGILPSKHYGGYISVNETTGKKLYYYLVESERNPAKDPVVLWLNGGPGCSSLDGFIYENGPFKFKAGIGSLPDLELNPYSWSKVSSVIYLDSPSGVGLSYSNTASDYNTGDEQTAVDTHRFLLKWFEKYPEFVGNPLYISGESYAGVYIPTLCAEIVKDLEAGVNPILNLKGYLIGNGATDAKFDGYNALVPFAHGMGLISEQFFQELSATCEGNFWRSTNASCQSSILDFDNALVGLNLYNVLEPCYYKPHNLTIQSANHKLPQSFKMLGDSNFKQFPVRKRMFGRAWPYRAYATAGRIASWPELSRKMGHRIDVECVNDEVATTWLNDESVRKSIHAPPVKELEWVLCTDIINFQQTAGSMIRHHVEFTKKGYRLLIYSGDHDMCIPYTGTEAWMRSIGYKIIDEWRAWMTDDQVSGYTQGYDHNLTFLTIKGSGHTVPEYKPKEAFTFYSRWLAGDPI